MIFNKYKITSFETEACIWKGGNACEICLKVKLFKAWIWLTKYMLAIFFILAALLSEEYDLNDGSYW